jgi:hypothetical protein
MNMTRRALLGSTVAACALTGCTASEIATISAEAAAELSDVATALVALTPVLPTLTGIPAATLTTIESDIGQASTFAQSINGASTAIAGESAVGKVVTLAGDGLKLLSGFSLPAKVSQVVTALQLVLPALGAAAGLSSAAVSAPAPEALAAARATLRNAHALLAAG